MNSAPQARNFLSSFLHQHKTWRLDVVILVILIARNPLLWGYRLASSLSPDTIAYLIFSEHLVDTGQVFLPGWGHVDIAKLLPPLYPLLIAAVNQFGGDIITSAISVSMVCLLLATIPMYLMVRTIAKPWLAAGLVLLNHANLNYLFYGSSIYSEATFIVLLFGTLVLLLFVTKLQRTASLMFLLIGALSALAFLSRQIGIILLIFVVGWVIADAFLRRQRWKMISRQLFWLGVGWLSLVGPYMVALQIQAHQTPFKQTFRLGHYKVSVTDPAELAEIARIDKKPSDSYEDIYKKRRLQRRLLPDATEMHAFVIRDSKKINNNRINQIILTNISRPRKVIRNLAANISNLASLAGVIVMILFGIAVISSLVWKSTLAGRRLRLMVPAFIATYIVILSLMTGLIERYLAVLLPFIAVHLAIELAVLLHWLKNRFPGSMVMSAVSIIGVSVVLLTAPYTLLNASMLPPKSLQSPIPGRAIPNREPAFALLPLYSFMTGGSFRILPNDSLDKVVHYGQLTGVRWIIVPANPKGRSQGELSLYKYALWLKNPNLLKTCHRLLRFHGAISLFGEEQFVFRLRPSDNSFPRARGSSC